MKPRIVVDSSIWVDMLAKGPRYSACRTALDLGSICGVPSVVIYEVCRKIAAKTSSDKALKASAYLRQYSILDLTDEVALHAVDLSIEHKLGMADSIVLAHAFRERATLLTLDNDFRAIPGTKVL
jgi:predicted nucleic acid-binding protein